MLSLSNDLRQIVARANPKTIIITPDGELCHFLSSIEDDLLEKGYLNIILRKRSGEVLGIAINSFQASNLVVSGQEKMAKLNASCIMDISLSDGIIHTQHWDGFDTLIDLKTLEVVEQIFTK